MVGKIYAGILVDRVRRVTGGLIDDEQGGFRVERRCVDQFFTLKQIGEKARQIWRRRAIGLIRKLWQVLRMYDIWVNG